MINTVVYDDAVNGYLFLLKHLLMRLV